MSHAATLTSALSRAIAAFLVDSGGCILASTSAADAILEHGSRANDALLRDRLPRGLVDAACLDESIARALSTKDTIETPPLARLVVGSGERDVRVRIVPYDGYVIVFIDDVRELVAGEMRRARAQESEVFAAMAEVIAHRVGNPLAGFSAALQLTSASLASGDPRRETLRRAQDEVKRLAAVCADLLAFADAGTPARARLDLRTVAEAAVARVATTNGAVIAVEHEREGEHEGEDAGAFGDAELLVRALRHLLLNALEAGARRVVVVVGPGALRVDDDGPGLAADVGEHAFDPFFTTKVSGTGLGLAIARRAVAAMGGTIAAGRSTLGGASFAIRLETSA